MSAVIRLPGRLGAVPDSLFPLRLVDAVSHGYRLRGRDLSVRDGISLSLDRNAFPPTSCCIPGYYTPVVVTNEKLIKEKPDKDLDYARFFTDDFLPK